MDGSGHYLDPFLIRSEQDLSDIRLNSSAHYKLIKDIDLINDWVPIPSFSGVLDGAGHTISGVRSVAASGANGFFVRALGSPTIENIVMRTSGIGISGNGSSYTGLLFGEASAAVVTIRRSGFFGKVATGGDRAGGLIGYFTGSSKAFMQDIIVGVGLSGSAVRTGAIFGYLEVTSSNFGLVSNVYYNSSLVPAARPVGSGNAMPTAPIAYTDPSNPAQFPNLDFINTWEIKNSQPSLTTTPRLWVGEGYIAGSGDGILTVQGVPSERDIYLLDAGTMFMLKSTKSSPSGHYMFSGLDASREYIVMARDSIREFEPFAWDYVKPASDLTVAEQQAMRQTWQAQQ